MPPLKIAQRAPAPEVDPFQDDPIDASPTKELFIDMLTRDILLPAAILDLVDNCVDGARRLRGTGNFNGLKVDLLVAKPGFQIKDNCGGIDIKTAEEHAFRFGRPDGAMETTHSIGRFGVGMKRAIFKMGRILKVESITKAERFEIDLNIDDWAKKPSWRFGFAKTETNQNNAVSKTGTTIAITGLKTDVAEAFDVPTFATGLAIEIQTKLNSAIENGLTITVNGVKVNAEPLILRTSKELAPAVFRTTYTPEEGKKKVMVVLYCGLGKSEDVQSAGWHVFCNGRQIVVGDKTNLTGWGSKDSGITIPNFHGQFNLIRGYAFFDSDDASVLPWNTTKTGVNADAGVYRTVRLQMISLMRPVVNFCNKLKEERESLAPLGKTGPLSRLLAKSTVKPLTKIIGRPFFDTPAATLPAKGPPAQRISYERSRARVAEVKKRLKAGSAREVGEMTFDYYYNAEVKR